MSIAAPAPLVTLVVRSRICDIRRQLGIELMRADMENKRADSCYKLDLSRWEPWNVLAAGLGAGAAIMAAAVALVAAVFHAISH